MSRITTGAGAIIRMLKSALNRFVRSAIAYFVRRSVHCKIINSENKTNARRYMPLLLDEYWSDNQGLIHQLPWYLPFNVLLHCWTEGDEGYMHDHPRWSITVVLQGGLKEQTPTKDKWLTPGSIVFRSHKFTHRIVVPERYKGKTWTMFIVGRRLYRQSYYKDNGALASRYEDVYLIRSSK